MSSQQPDLAFTARRSAVYARKGMVAASQPLAAEAGLQILRAGGNAVDAAIAVAAALGVTEPCSTGLGGDCFLLYYNAETKAVEALNGSGRAAKAATLERVVQDCYGGGSGSGGGGGGGGVDMTGRTVEHKGDAEDGQPQTSMPPFHAHSITVPGTAGGWDAAVAKWGTMPLAQVLAPAIDLAENGYPVAPICAHHWGRGVPQLRRGPHANEVRGAVVCMLWARRRVARRRVL